jgi:acyl-CoA thioester hydrolase
LLRVRVLLREQPHGSRVLFEYEIYNEANDLLTEGSTLMVFVSGHNGRPTAIPKHVLECLTPYFAASATKATVPSAG